MEVRSSATRRYHRHTKLPTILVPSRPMPHDSTVPPGLGSYRKSLTGQLDLFAHSRTVILINDLIDSLLERNVARVCERLQLLRSATPGHPMLEALATLRDALEHWPMAISGARETARVVEWLDSEVAVAATTCLGASAPTSTGAPRRSRRETSGPRP